MEKILTFNFLMPGLNGSDGLLREHWSKRKTRKDKLILMLKSVIKDRPKYKDVVVTYERHSCRAMDWDNHCASFKIIGDAMVEAGILLDDSPTIIKEFIPKWFKVDKKNLEKTVVILNIKD